MAAYDIFLLAAILVFTLGLFIVIRLDRLPWPKALLPCWGAIPVAFFGARLLNRLLYLKEPVSFFQSLLSLDRKHFTLFGGAALAAGFIMVTCRLLNLPARRYLDLASPLAGLSIAVTRVGCLLTGCCFGLPTNLPWGIVPPYGGAAHQMQLEAGLVGRYLNIPLSPLPIHPTQIYELMAALIAGGIALYLLYRRAPAGVPAAGFGLSLSILRLLIFYTRAFPGATALSLFIRGPVVYGVSISLSLILLIVALRNQRRG